MYDQWHDQLYGNFRTRTFADIFPDQEQFYAEYINNGIKPILSAENIPTLYYLLYGQYGNSHIASSDENTFKYRLWSIIFMYGPAWQKRLDIQGNLMKLTEKEVRSGSYAIHNHAFNPSTAPSTDTEEELSHINEQNTSRYKKGVVDGYMDLWDLISTDVTKYFLDRFQELFLSITEPEYPLWYTTPIEGGDNDN